MINRFSKWATSSIVVFVLIVILAVPVFAVGIQFTQSQYAGEACAGRAELQAVYYVDTATYADPGLNNPSDTVIRVTDRLQQQKYLVCEFVRDSEGRISSILISIGRSAVWTRPADEYRPRSARD
jgi:flagellar basal body-associated protein FliL